MSEIYADTTGVPPRQFLPKTLHKLLDAREAAHEKFVDYEDQHVDVIHDGWEARAIAKDEAAGAAAVAAGRDPLDEPSHLEDAQRQRPRILGALKALAAEVRRTDAALASAVRRELPAIEAAIEARVSAAASAYIDAQRAADEARQSYGAALQLRAWVVDWSRLGLRTDYQELPAATPVTFDGHEAVDIYDRPIARGAAEVVAIDESYGRVVAEPKRVIRSKTNGQEIEIDATHAAALVDKGQAEYADDVA
ncbi:hypothetical protein [Streptomyces sp. NPDC001507]|uniref:hypothetical protein n=1 Tax=Streptomyces sp. NPDC001507 TaxID=3364579 RepID=UPI0036A0E14A